MRNFSFLALVIFPFFLTAQTANQPLLTSGQIQKLAKVATRIQEDFDRQPKDTTIFRGLAQGWGTSVQVWTDRVEECIAQLEAGYSPDLLRLSFPQVQVDREVLIIKTQGRNYNKENTLRFRTNQVGQVEGMDVTLILDSLGTVPATRIGSYVYEAPKSYREGHQLVRAFLIEESFRQPTLPSNAQEWIYFADVMIGQQAIFAQPTFTSQLGQYQYGLIDSMQRYFYREAGRPQFSNRKAFFDGQKELNRWESRKDILADSLFAKDPIFREKFRAALGFAQSEKIIHWELIAMVAKFRSKEAAYELMRYYPIQGTCSTDTRPTQQFRQICQMAAELKDWPIFIRTALNLLNDRASRVANSSFAAASRGTFINSLEQLPIRLDELLLGTALHMSNPKTTHYLGSNDRISRAVAQSNFTEAFVQKLERLLVDQQLDAFNQLHLHNLFAGLIRYTKDSLRQEDYQRRLNLAVNHLHPKLAQRIQYPHTAMLHLLPQHRQQILDSLQVESFQKGMISDYNFLGEAWRAIVQQKQDSVAIAYQVLGNAKERLGDLDHFFRHRYAVAQRLQAHPLIRQYLDQDGSRLVVNWPRNQSLLIKNYRWYGYIPYETRIKYHRQLKEAVVFTTEHGAKGEHARWLLYPNGDLLLIELPASFSLASYNFENLKTETKGTQFRPEYYSFKIFDPKGNLIREL